MSESSMRSRVLFSLRKLNAIPVENLVWPGTPDVNYREGWIELKEIKKKDIPKKQTTSLPLEHFTKVQRIWIKQRKQNNGNIFLVLKVNLDWFILPPLWAIQHLGINATLTDVFSNALVHLRPFNEQKFLEFFENENRTKQQSGS